MKLIEIEPVYLRIRWEARREAGGGTVTLEATLCKRHREQIARQHPSARGWGKLGESCDLCEGRKPMRG